MHWNLGRIYLHLKSNTKLTTLPTLCDTGKLDCVALRRTLYVSFNVYIEEGLFTKNLQNSHKRQTSPEV